MAELFVMATMDCEPVRSMIPESRRDISRSGPADWQASERIHPGIRQAVRGLRLAPDALRAPRGRGRAPRPAAGTGAAGLLPRPAPAPLQARQRATYRLDLGAYPAAEQRRMIAAGCRRVATADRTRSAVFPSGLFLGERHDLRGAREAGLRGRQRLHPRARAPRPPERLGRRSGLPARRGCRVPSLSGASSFVEVAGLRRLPAARRPGRCPARSGTSGPTSRPRRTTSEPSPATSWSGSRRKRRRSPCSSRTCTTTRT